MVSLARDGFILRQPSPRITVLREITRSGITDTCRVPTLDLHDATLGLALVTLEIPATLARCVMAPAGSTYNYLLFGQLGSLVENRQQPQMVHILVTLPPITLWPQVSLSLPPAWPGGLSRSCRCSLSAFSRQDLPNWPITSSGAVGEDYASGASLRRSLKSGTWIPVCRWLTPDIISPRNYSPIVHLHGAFACKRQNHTVAGLSCPASQQHTRRSIAI